MENNSINKIAIAIAFKDNKTLVSFDLTKNTVFYGNNGRGKTRILKTIELLYGLAKKLDYDSLVSQLNYLNLSSLSINNKSYSKLFSKYQDSIINDKERFNEFIKINEVLFVRISNLLEVILHSFLNAENIYYKRNIEWAFNRFNNVKSIGSLVELDDLIFQTRRTINIIKKIEQVEGVEFKFKSGARLISTELRDLIMYLMQRVSEMKFTVTNKDLEIRSALKDEKEKVLKALGNKGARYLTVDSNFESEKIFKEISSYFNDLNIEYISNLWSDRAEFDSIKEKVIKYKEKFRLLNSILCKYSDSIKIDYDFKGNVIFIKSGSSIDFIKLSSGEKRLIIIFLNLIFSEENIILIDEPEISLSLDYQNKIIGHIMNIANKENKKVMIATHAPYIYKDFTSYGENQEIKV